MLPFSAVAVLGLASLGSLASALSVEWASVYIFAADTKAPVRADGEGTYTVAKNSTTGDDTLADQFQFANGGQGVSIFSNRLHGFVGPQSGDGPTLQGQFLRNSSTVFKFEVVDLDPAHNTSSGLFKIKALRHDLFWTATPLSINNTHNVITLQPPTDSPRQRWSFTHHYRDFTQVVSDMTTALNGELATDLKEIMDRKPFTGTW